MTAVASPAWALASVLVNAGLVDLNADVFREVWPSGECPDAAILLTATSATTAYGVTGYETLIRVIVRDAPGRVESARARASLVYDALLNFSTPAAVTAGTGITLHLSGLWPTPPIVSRLDVHGRPEFVLACRVMHADPIVAGP